jgi:uncharacterized membrane protein YeaQ/YmgE (transglycosylase-associated protein family)
MDFTVNMEVAGGLLVIAAAILFGVIAQFIGEPRTGFEWLIDAIAFGVGAVVASEFVTAWSTVEPVWQGVALAPALIGGLVVGLVVELATRYLTGGSYHHGAMAA